jgi:hypothetical protein
MIDLKNSFIEYAKKHGDATLEGDDKTANKMHDKLSSLYEKIKKEEKWEVLKEVIDLPDESVRLWAATFLLRHDERIALNSLNKLSKSSKIFGLSASTTIDMWHKKMLDLL